MTKTQYHMALWKHRAYIIALMLGGLVTVALIILMIPILLITPDAAVKLTSIRDALTEKVKDLKTNRELLREQEKRLYP